MPKRPPTSDLFRGRYAPKATDVRRSASGSPSADGYFFRLALLKVCKFHNEMMKSRAGVDFATSTYTRYQTTYDHVSKFLLHQYKLEGISLKQIQYSFITDLEHYLKTIRKCNHDSRQKCIRNFRKIINNAIKNN